MGRKRLTEREAKELHDWMMQDPEYRKKWNALTAALFGTLADLPEDALAQRAEESK